MATTTNFGVTNDHAAGGVLAAATVNSIADDAELTRWGYSAITHDDTANYDPADAVDEKVVLAVSGALTAARNMILRTTQGARWWVYNGTTGGFTLTVKTSAGTGIAIANGYRALVYCDGTNIVQAVSELVTARLTSPRIVTSILDTNGLELALLTATASAVNEVTLANAATGGSPTLSATGDDTNIDLTLAGKGTGRLKTTSPKIVTDISDTNGNELLKVTATASAVNEVTLANAATGGNPVLSATGGDTNISIVARAKGSGRVKTDAGVPGTTATLADLGGGLHQNTTAVGNVGVGEDTLMSYTLPANVLGTNGDRLEVVAFGSFAANANGKNLKLKFGATTIMATTALGFNATSWQIRCTIIRTGATAQLASAMFVSGDAVLAAKVYQATPAETLSGTVALLLTGEATADNDIVQSALTVQWEPGS